MQVSVESTSGLERRLTVELPEEAVEQEVGTRLDNLMHTARVPGFRPGKAPMKVVARRFGAAVRGEVVGDLVHKSFHEALAREALRPAGEPRFGPLQTEPGSGIRFTAVFEVFPDIRITDLDSIEVRRPDVAVKESDVDNTIEGLRRQRRDWREVTRGAQAGDRITCDTEGEMNGRLVDELSREHQVVEVGAGGAVPDLDHGLVGMEPHSARDIEVRFPDDHPMPSLAGRTARMHVEVRSVEEGVLPELDADFIRGFGVESGEFEDFRREVRSNLERELEAATAALTRNRLLDALLARHPVDVPVALMAEELGHAGVANPSGDHASDAAVASVRLRLQRGLMLSQLVSDHGRPPDSAAVRAEIERIAATYEDSARMVSWFYSDEARLGTVRIRVAEREAVEETLARVKVVDEPSEFDELMNPGQTSEAPS